MFRQNVWVTGTEVSKWLILITDQFNSSLLLTVTHAMSPTSLLFSFFFLPCLETDRYKHTYAQGLYIIACLHQAHTTQLFSTSAVSPKSFKFPSRAYWILSKVSIGRLVFMQSHMGLYGPTGHLGTAEEHEVWMVSYNKPLSSTSSSLLSSCWFHILPTLQLPPASSLQPPCFSGSYF